jgi:hypothetical protein
MRGLDKLFPCGPMCEYTGKTPLCLVEGTPNGSITSELLAKALKHMDRLELFDRSYGICPFFLLHGYGSLLELPFVEYITDPAHEWTVFIGVPYGTSMWQVGDSIEQNGQYKETLKNVKEQLLALKDKHCMTFTLTRHDIMWLVRYDWEKSFARVRTNKQAIAERGWGPMNYVLLDHPELQEIEECVIQAE